MLVIAHRGANREALENSWSAFEKAIEAGAARIELDVQLSADGHAVIMHDDSLQHSTGRRASIASMTRAEISDTLLKNGEPIPFLDQVIERLLSRVELNIEIKGTSEELAKVVADLVEPCRERDRVIVSCFQAQPLVWLSRHAPTIKRACLWSRDAFSWPFFATLAPQIFLERCQTTILHPHVALVNENLMDQARARGWTVYAWVAMSGEEGDREGLWTAMKTMGLDGLCTNYPRQLKSWLEDATLDEEQYKPFD